MASLAIVVLGQSLNSDGSPPESLVRRCEEAADRFDNLLLGGTTAPILVPCGGDPAGTGTTEAEVMTRLLTEQYDVPAGAVVSEQASQNTCQNAYNVLKLLQTRGGGGGGSQSSSWAIQLVTSQFHMPRALYIFEAVLHGTGVSVTPAPAANGLSPEETANRLSDEKKFLTKHLLQDFLPRHIPGHPVQPLPQPRLDTAVSQVELLLQQATERGMMGSRDASQAPSSNSAGATSAGGAGEGGASGRVDASRKAQHAAVDAQMAALLSKYQSK
jgi:uncharacterized SAM-binding protein YcdF (DUF218 family)